MESIVEAPESFKMKIAKEENSFEKLDEKLDEDFQVPDQLTILEDQIAMESLNKHLKKITQLPSGLKQKVESDLIRKLTTVEPKPKSKCWLAVVESPHKPIDHQPKAFTFYFQF